MIAIYVHVVMLWLEVVKNGRIFAFVKLFILGSLCATLVRCCTTRFLMVGLL